MGALSCANCQQGQGCAGSYSTAVCQALLAPLALLSTGNDATRILQVRGITRGLTCSRLLVLFKERLHETTGPPAMLQPMRAVAVVQTHRQRNVIGHRYKTL